MAHDPTNALRQLLRQADELEQRMLQLQESFVKIRHEFEAMFAEGAAELQEPSATFSQPSAALSETSDTAVRLPKPHLRDPGIVDMAISALATPGEEDESPAEAE